MKDIMILVGAGQIGMAIARRIGFGMKIVVGDYKLANAEAIALTMTNAGFDVIPIEMDLSSRDSILSMIAEAQKHGEIAMLVNSAGLSPSQAPSEAILKVDLYGTAVLLEEVGKVIKRGGVGVTNSSQSGYRMPALSAEIDEQLATTPTEELLALDVLQPENIHSTLHAYQMSKRCNVKRVMAEAVKWGERGARINSISPGMDASKVIAAAALYDGDPWNLIGHGQENWVIPTEALPIITVPTLAATGSEMNCGAVISNDETKVKSFVSTECLFPKVDLVDPELTLSVPKDQTAYGVCDIITHVTEGYFNGVDGTPIQDRFAEGVIVNAIEWGKKAVADGNDLEARAQVQWASIVALNGWIQAGVQMVPPVHMIEHALSAHHDIPHGAGLAIVNPAWMRFAAKHRPERFAQFARRVFGLSCDGKYNLTLAMEGIDAYVAFLKDIGCPTTLSEVGIGDELFEQYAKDAVLVVHDEDGNLLGRPTMSKNDIIEVLRSAL